MPRLRCSVPTKLMGDVNSKLLCCYALSLACRGFDTQSVSTDMVFDLLERRSIEFPHRFAMKSGPGNEAPAVVDVESPGQELVVVRGTVGAVALV